MGLSDDWLKIGVGEKGEYELSDNAKYKLCGNGVVTNVVEAIIKRLYG
jgi:site-specific DNA-cytosine methylase